MPAVAGCINSCLRTFFQAWQQKYDISERRNTDKKYVKKRDGEKL